MWYLGENRVANENESIRIVCNGEIYNSQSLRSELIKRGHTFRTQTDTEGIVHLYEEYGESCVNHLRGMFAFAICDTRQRRLFAARDRLGQKPFFFVHRGPHDLFASEIKALLLFRLFLKNSRLAEHGIFQQGQINKILDDHLNGIAD